MKPTPPMTRKEAIAAAFGEAAVSYDAAGGVQRAVAERLAGRIAALDRPERPRVLEIGCGTGFLSQALRARLPAADWLLTDLSEAMVGRCRATLGAPADTGFLVMDGERPALAPASVDLICSSLVFQWFEDPVPTLGRLAALLRPGGVLAFATLACGSFIEWRLAHADVGLEAGMPSYAAPATLQRLWPPGGDGQVTDERLPWPYANGHAFLKDLKRLGAHLPTPDHRPVPAGTLRRILRAFDRPEGIAITYHVAFGVFRRAGGPS